MATRKKATGRAAEVGRYFRGLPVVDATEPLRVVVNRQDVNTSRKLDPNNCVFAKACQRLFNSHAVLILRRTAYVELPDSRGRRVVNRFVIGAETADKIAQFDKTGEFPEGGFLFSVPGPSKTMAYHAKQAAEYRKRVLTGKHVIKHNAKPNKRFQKTMEGVRDGRGRLGINYAW